MLSAQGSELALRHPEQREGSPNACMVPHFRDPSQVRDEVGCDNRLSHTLKNHLIALFLSNLV